jgi:hypothetical protein
VFIISYKPTTTNLGVTNNWAISGQYLSTGIKIKITLECRPNEYLRYDILVSLKCKSKHIFYRIFR